MYTVGRLQKCSGLCYQSTLRETVALKCTLLNHPFRSSTPTLHQAANRMTETCPRDTTGGTVIHLSALVHQLKGI